MFGSIRRYSFVLLLLSVIGMASVAAAEEKWSGVDETVVEKFAEEAGRPARDPYLNVGEGDLLLFAFLLGGALGGFVAGYYYRELFSKRPHPVESG